MFVNVCLYLCNKSKKDMSYTLKVKETNNKAAKFLYEVINDETGEVVSSRKSNRVYVACTFNGAYYFGRLDLIGKGDHGFHLKASAAEGRTPYAIAYKK